jgi:hypothetical protein
MHRRQIRHLIANLPLRSLLNARDRTPPEASNKVAPDPIRSFAKSSFGGPDWGESGTCASQPFSMTSLRRQNVSRSIAVIAFWMRRAGH